MQTFIFSKNVGLDIWTALFLQGASDVSDETVLELPAREHQKHPVEIVQLVYLTRQHIQVVGSSTEP